MAITTFDTLKFVRRLEGAGMPSEQAEVQAEVLTEAFNVNLESLVTKDIMDTRFAEQRSYMDTRFAEQQSYIDTRFAEQQSYIDTRFAEQQSYIDTRFAEQKSYMVTRFAEQQSYMDTRFAEWKADTDTNFRVMFWLQGILVAAIVLPYLERLLAL